MQEGGDGPGAVIGIQIGGVVAEHAVNVGEDIRREDVLVGSDTDRLEVTAGLKLGDRARRILKLGELLQLLVGDFVTRKFVADAESWALAKAPAVPKLPPERTAWPCSPGCASRRVLTSMMPPILRPDSAGRATVRKVHGSNPSVASLGR